MQGQATAAGVFLGRRADDWRPLPAIVLILVLGMLLAAGLMFQALRPFSPAYGDRTTARASAMFQEAVTAPGDLSAASDATIGGSNVGALDPELARAVVLRQPGVVSAIWLDRSTLLARVDGASAYGSDRLLALCRALAQAGDASGVQVQMQNAQARSSEELEPLVLTCGAGAGQVRRRPSPSSVAPSVRAVYRGLAPVDALQARQRADAAARVLQRSTPEMR